MIPMIGTPQKGPQISFEADSINKSGTVLLKSTPIYYDTYDRDSQKGPVNII